MDTKKLINPVCKNCFGELKINSITEIKKTNYYKIFCSCILCDKKHEIYYNNITTFFTVYEV